MLSNVYDAQCNVQLMLFLIKKKKKKKDCDYLTVFDFEHPILSPF